MHEDWGADGAGNGLGTLYAYTKARAKAKTAGHDLDARARGRRHRGHLPAPPARERASPPPRRREQQQTRRASFLPRRDLPGRHLRAHHPRGGRPSGRDASAPKRAGRCSVFWGDQIFVPSAGTAESGAHHADILAQMGPMPDEAQWIAKGLEKYGLITVNAEGEAAQVEKVSYDTARRLLATFGEVRTVDSIPRVLLHVLRVPLRASGR